ncbi:hypothetical protein MMC29_001620 [Sticta canariensis]|nr:hypothetical protein [Sticta canariensis]
MQSLTTRLVAGARFLLGFSVLLLTNPMLALFKFPTSPISTYPYRLFGVRDAVIGGLLWTANTPELVKQALLVGTLIDSIDLLSTCAAVLSSDLVFPAAAWAVGVIVLFLAIQLWALSKLRSQRGAKIQ